VTVDVNSLAGYHSKNLVTGDFEWNLEFDWNGSGNLAIQLNNAQPLDAAYLNIASTSVVGGAGNGGSGPSRASFIRTNNVIKMRRTGNKVTQTINGVSYGPFDTRTDALRQLISIAGSAVVKLRKWEVVTPSATVPAPTTLSLTTLTPSPQPPTVGVVRLTLDGIGITANTIAEITGPSCPPCVPNARVSWLPNTLVVDAILLNPGQFSVRLKDGSTYSPETKTFTVGPATQSGPGSFTTTFLDSSYTSYLDRRSSDGTHTPGSDGLTINPNGGNSGLVEKQYTTGDATWRLRFWYTSGNLAIQAQTSVGNDAFHLNILPTGTTSYGGSARAGYPSVSSFQNRWNDVEFKRIGSDVQITINGALMGTFPSNAGGIRMFVAGSDIADWYELE
jgi:hypothetical protein